MLITRRGYQINKKKLTKEELNELNEELNIIPKLIPPYNLIDEGEPIKLIHTTTNNIFLPRYYGIEKYGDIFDSKLFNSKTINCEFKGKLNEQQINIINDILPKIYEYHGGLISLPCGYGKTILALYIISILKLKTIILVHKESLKEQWIQRINEFLDNSNIGIIQQNKININSDIIVGMIPSIAERNYDKIFNDIGLLIVDECHHIASKIFSKCLYKIGADYTIGLSATPKRKDGLTKIIHWYLGPQLIYIKNRDKNINTLIYNIKYECNDNKFKILTRRYKGKDTINTVDMITNLTKINDRNILILNIIKKLLDDNERYIMILSERIDHLELLKNNIDNFIKVNKLNILTEYYKGSSSKDERRNAENNNNIHVLFGSYQIASEGLDIPRLNTLILASPKKDVEQCIGRIQRKIHNINPLVIDILDQIKPFQNYLNNKKKLYKLNKYVFIDFINNINNKFNLDNLNNININNFIDNNSCNNNENDNDEIDNDDNNNNNNNYIDF